MARTLFGLACHSRIAEWQGKKELRSRTDGTLDPDSPPVRLYDSLRDCQTKTRAATLRSPCMPEARKYAGDLRLWDPDSRVFNRYDDLTAVSPGLNEDGPLVGCELRGIPDQVQ